MTQQLKKALEQSLKNNACMIYSKKYIDFSDLSVSILRAPYLIDIECIGIVNHNDLVSIIYTKFLEKASKSLEYNSISRIVSTIEKRLMHDIDNGLLSEPFMGLKTLFSLLENECEKENIELILALRDFEYLNDNKTNSFWRLRSIFQENKFIKLIVITSEQRITKLKQSDSFYKFFDIINAGEEDYYFELIEGFGKIDLKPSEAHVRYIIKKLGSDPYRISIFSTILYKIFSQSKDKLISIDMLIISTLKEYIFVSTPFYKTKIDELRKIKHGLEVYKNFFLEGMAHKNILLTSMLHELEKENQINNKNRDRITRVLAEKGYLRKNNSGKYVVEEPLFSDYITSRIGLEELSKDISYFLIEGQYNA